jgi:hypothetical protein
MGYHFIILRDSSSFMDHSSWPEQLFFGAIAATMIYELSTMN